MLVKLIIVDFSKSIENPLYGVLFNYLLSFLLYNFENYNRIEIIFSLKYNISHPFEISKNIS